MMGPRDSNVRPKDMEEPLCHNTHKIYLSSLLHTFFVIFQIRGSDREMSELRSNNQVLSERLESLSRSFNSYSHTSSHGSTSSVQMSLLNEMEMSTSGSDSDRSLYLRRYCTARTSKCLDWKTSQTRLR